ncbi:putative thioredoxin-like protein 1 [Plasmodium gaboni]|uniref:protein-disulfide reductase n=1 Tax=Plasmodium gaboni TaxID=647221 RepID=A0A151LLY0_9APIC|nr:putative thioredoxin-like protein 1 [Plasmodium gaboni]KYO00172.1 putative thioredoxin-like protein 1 [Plasmodium gaboni]
MACVNFNSPYQAEKRRTSENADNSKLETVYMPINYSDMDLILFPEGSLKNINNTVVNEKHLFGKSVAIFFSNGSDPKCRAFLPFLQQYYKTINEGGSSQKIEVIFVSIDPDRKSFEDHKKHMPWLYVDVADPLTDILKKHFRVTNSHEVPFYGSGPRSDVPCLMVVGSDGREAQLLHICSGRDEGEKGLLRWDFRNNIYTPNKKETS